MAVLPIFERVETQAIMNALLGNPQSAKELNSTVVLKQKLCSTSTLYRRLGELVVASILNKDGTIFTVSTYGKNLFTEFQKQANALSYRDSRLLSQFRKPTAFKELLVKLNISPNYLQKVFKEFLAKNLIYEIDSSQIRFNQIRKSGRPKIYYQLTAKGREVVEATKKLERRARRR